MDPSHTSRPAAAGVDIGTNRWDLAIIDAVSVREGLVVPRLVFYGKMRDEQEATWVCRQYGVQSIVADSMPDGTLVLRWQKNIVGRYGVRRFWRAQYNTAPSQVEFTENESEGILRMDKTLTLDSLKHAFATAMGIFIPQNYREIDRGNWLKEMTCSTKVPVIWHGIATYRWEGPPDDHAFNAMNYAKVAMEYGGLLKWGSASLMGATRGEVDRSSFEDDDEISGAYGEDDFFGDLVLQA